jgi:hypothetical protein
VVGAVESVLGAVDPPEPVPGGTVSTAVSLGVPVARVDAVDSSVACSVVAPDASSASSASLLLFEQAATPSETARMMPMLRRLRTVCRVDDM